MAACAAAALATPAAASAECKLIQIAEFHVDPHSRSPIVDGTINGKPIKVLFDTGSNFSWMPNHEAQKLGLILTQLPGYHTYSIGGQSDLYQTTIKDFRLGDFAKANMPMQVTGDPLTASDVAMVLGDDFFAQIDTEFDLPHNAVRLFRPEGCAPAQLVYWGPAGYSQSQLLPWDAHRPATESEAYLNGRRLLAEIDTGAYASIVDDRFASGLGVHSPTDSAKLGGAHSIAGGGQAAWVGDFDSFALGDEKVGHVHLQVMDLIGGSKYEETNTRIARNAGEEDTPAMLIGADFLHAHRVFVDVKDHLIMFSYEGGPVFAPEEATASAATK